MRRGLYFVLMVVLVLRGLTGAAMAAGVLQPPLPANVLHAQEISHCQAAARMQPPHEDHGMDHAAQSMDAPAHASDHSLSHHHDHDVVAVDAAAASSHDGPSAVCAAHDHHAASCSACEICHSAMLDAPAGLAPALRPLSTLRPTAAAQFDSAPAALAVKPPIA